MPDVDYEHLEIAPLTDQERRAWLGRQYANDTPHPLTTIAAFLAGLAIGAIAWILLAILVAHLAAPSSAETTAPVDLSGMSSARLSGAPQAHSSLSGALSPSPAVANVATSGGPDGLTSPMPATPS